MSDWEAAIAAERMAVDGAFTDRVAASSLSPQQWNLAMTAVEFHIENPSTPETATLVAETDRVAGIVDELEAVADAGPMGQSTGSAASTGGDGGGFLDGILDGLGLGGNDEPDRLDEIEELTAEYAERLEAKLRERGRWETVCERAAGG